MCDEDGDQSQSGYHGTGVQCHGLMSVQRNFVDVIVS